MVGSVYAQDQTTGNLVYTTVNPAPAGTNIGQSWTGFSNVTSTGGNSTSDNGNVTGYNPNTGTFMFGYNQGTIYYTYAINQALALAGAGIQVRGYNWSWEINNNNYDNRQGSTDTLNARVTTFAANNSTILQQDYWTYNTRFDWTTFSGTVNYNNPLSPAEYGNMQLMFSGRDSGFWAGYYGPMVRNISLSLNYAAVPHDPCTSDPLSSPSCPGYQQAYHDQQCSSNPLHATTCPGYQQAYYTQQCSANPLYDSGCPGYQQAYFNQQCSNNPLYNNQCPGYAQAYFNQQCSNNSLYSNQCPGYQQAYFNQQCSLNPLYNTSCIGYEAAYFNQQCSLNTLYNQACPGYTVAYYNLQCSNNPLYDSGCPGYAQAYFDQQCSNNGLYDRKCPNYAQEFAKQQLLNQQNNATQTASVVVPTTTEPVIQVKEDGKVSTDVPLVADPVVNSVLTKNTDTKKEDKREEKKEEPKAEKPKENTARQAAIAVATKPDPATQTQSEKEFEQTVASQSAAVATISFVPGFSAYQNAIIPDTNALTMQRQYNKPVIDNARAMRQLNGASDRMHQEMINEQYRFR